MSLYGLASRSFSFLVPALCCNPCCLNRVFAKPHELFPPEGSVLARRGKVQALWGISGAPVSVTCLPLCRFRPAAVVGCATCGSLRAARPALGRCADRLRASGHERRKRGWCWARR
jgi:hypothetical protein